MAQQPTSRIEMKTPDMMGALPVQSVQNATNAYLSSWKQVEKLQMEVLRFVNQRLLKDFAHSGRLLACKGPTEFLDAQMDFCNRYLDDYTRESQVFNNLARDTVKDIQGTLQENLGLR